MEVNTSTLTATQLRRAAEIADRLDALRLELEGILTGTAAPSGSRGRGMSAAGRARIAKAQRARWAKQRANARTS